ncbi:CsbD family protein [Streptomyces sp. NPDC051896]|uniref:CsbD family protein n=1 Tax=Streptomyces sp. NPDC051896 TaxID=3155416 RepID=UPI00342D72B9
MLPHVPLKMLVFDRRDALVPLTVGSDGLRSTAALVQRSPLCDAPVGLFEASFYMAVSHSAIFVGSTANRSAPSGCGTSLHAGRVNGLCARQSQIWKDGPIRMSGKAADRGDKIKDKTKERLGKALGNERLETEGGDRTKDAVRDILDEA